MRPLLRLVGIQRSRVLLQTLNVARVVKEEDRAVRVGEAGNTLFGMAIVALLANLLEQRVCGDFLELLVVGVEEDGDPR